jgi:hypothetical protein
MSAKMVERSYVDLSKYTKETRSHFTEHFIEPLIEMPVSVKASLPNHAKPTEKGTYFSTLAPLLAACKPVTLFLIDDSDTTTDTKWALVGNILMDAVELVCRQKRESLAIHFFHKTTQNRGAVTDYITAYELLYNWKPLRGNKSTSPFRRELQPFLDNWKNGILTPLNLVVLTDMKLKDRFYDLEVSVADVMEHDLQELTRELLHIQICHVGHHPGTKFAFQKLAGRLRSRHGTDRLGNLVGFTVCERIISNR